ncbi:hypothetical protein Ga0466249_004942 [Sporomusaceae bacterium BoRhaA]|uniref:hypothetical protein n=1 Tax=Pelorhabdus rhamnosifermentans TaxID=2772457 RepID=UPI001C060947|nr:hypothetical protein [Pelorhabdus rhamnosifermentans]MBU2703792.1 hypothetical protein [Pelorhabdus rhamnosifermentans]
MNEIKEYEVKQPSGDFMLGMIAREQYVDLGMSQCTMLGSFWPVLPEPVKFFL